MKKLIVFLLVACLSCSFLGMNVFAARYYGSAEVLETLGLFKGVSVDEYGTNFELERGAKRVEALVMLIRLLGQEEDALACQAIHNFADVPVGNWAYPYVAYAYEKGYTSGVSATEFAPDSEVNLNAFSTFLLRALGYDDAKGDFNYSQAIQKAEETGLLMVGTYGNGGDICLRDDCAYMSLRALNTKMNNSDNTLSDKLMEKGTVPAGSESKIKEVLLVEDKNTSDAYICDDALVMEDTSTYAEYDNDGKVLKRMIHIFYGNPFAKYLEHYLYDDAGKLVQKMSTDSAADDKLYQYTYDENNRLIRKDGYEEYLYEYDENNRVAKITSGENNMSFEYNDRIVTVRRTKFFDESGISLDFLDADSVVMYDGYDELECTNNYNADGALISSYDGENRLTYLAEFDDQGRYKTITYYTYMQTSDSPMFSGSSGSDSYTVEEFVYNENGDLVKVIQDKSDSGYTEPRSEFSFRYFGNGKLERVLWKMDKDDNYDDSGITWEQVYTVFDEEGHMKAPY